jgi:hypothetical protein
MNSQILPKKSIVQIPKPNITQPINVVIPPKNINIPNGIN